MTDFTIEGVMCTYQREIDRLNEVIVKLKEELKESRETIGPFEAPPKFMEITIND